MLGEYIKFARLRHVAMLAAMLADNDSLDHALRNDMKSFAGVPKCCPKLEVFAFVPEVFGVNVPNPLLGCTLAFMLNK